MATTFSIVRELVSIERDRGNKRLLLALYSACDDGGKPNRYLACSEQTKNGDGWESTRKGITIRKSELAEIIAALQQIDFDAKTDGKGLTDLEYIIATGYIT